MKFILFSVFTAILACNATTPNATQQANSTTATTLPEKISELEMPFDTIKKITKTPDEWRKQLGDGLVFNVLREKGTERAFSGKYVDNHEKGTYYCAACNLPLFKSTTKFESGTGWPSFFQSISKNNVAEIVDNSYGMSRTEVECARCGGHLGHVFEDGPKPTGLRYCMNSVSLNFIADKK